MTKIICKSKNIISAYIPPHILKKLDSTAKANGISRSEQVRSDMIKIYGVDNATTEKTP